ncbi:MAG: hypothetical protein VB094_09240 [Oscillibacter sp.]|nr:hypothetical protein [Oscillibacter sp.]
MKDCQQCAVNFLSYHGMYFKQIDPEQQLQKFLKEMQAGLRNEPCSLKMIPTYLRETAPKKEGPVIVLDIGGTHVRVAVVRLPKGQPPEISDHLEFPTPGVDHAVSSREFFRTIADGLRPVIDRSSRIGVCFSFATKPMQNKDAIVVAGGKQLQVPDLLGNGVGECLRAGLREDGLDDQKSVVVINDSVAATLGGRILHTDRCFSGYIGFIYGTGTNICYSEPQGFGGESMIINVESGAYCGFPSGDIDDRFDSSLIDVGQDRFEKMVSGGYQGGLMTEILRQAGKEQLFTPQCCEKIDEINDLKPQEIDEFLNYPYGKGHLAMCCAGDDDRRTIYYLMDLVTERSALLSAISLCASQLRAGIGKDPCRPAFITAEGSTFYFSKDFSRKLDYQMRRLGRENLGLYSEFFHVPNVTLAGTAIAGLSV